MNLPKFLLGDNTDRKEDIFVISFYCWLKGKMNNTDFFEATLQLIEQAQLELISA